jgi:hypothetical protein
MSVVVVFLVGVLGVVFSGLVSLLGCLLGSLCFFHAGSFSLRYGSLLWLSSAYGVVVCHGAYLMCLL